MQTSSTPKPPSPEVTLVHMNTWNCAFLWKHWVGQRWTSPAITKWTLGRKPESDSLLETSGEVTFPLDRRVWPCALLSSPRRGQGALLSVGRSAETHSPHWARGVFLGKKNRKKLCRSLKTKHTEEPQVRPPVMLLLVNTCTQTT